MDNIFVDKKNAQRTHKGLWSDDEQAVSKPTATAALPLAHALRSNRSLGNGLLDGCGNCLLGGGCGLLQLLSASLPAHQSSLHVQDCHPFLHSQTKIVSQSLHVKLTDLEEGVQAGSIATTKS